VAHAGDQDRLGVDPLVGGFVVVDEQCLVEQEPTGRAGGGEAGRWPLEGGSAPLDGSATACRNRASRSGSSPWQPIPTPRSSGGEPGEEAAHGPAATTSALAGATQYAS
jgi:hypothetical protein